MKRLQVIVAITLTYMLFGILLNSVGTVILQSITTFGQTKAIASTLEAFKDLPIAITSFLVASFLPRLGFRRAMMVGVGTVGLACLAMAGVPTFTTAQGLFAAIGVSFALVKVSAYSSIGLVTDTPAQHASLTSLIEGMFMVGVLSGYWIFGAFVGSSDDMGLGWTQVYWLLGALCGAILLLLATTALDESFVKAPGKTARDAFLAMLALIWRPLVMVFVLSAFLYVVIEQAIGTWLPTFNNEVLHLPQAMSIQAASIFAAALAIGRLGAGALLTRIAWYPLLNACVIAMAILTLISLPLTQGLEPVAGISWANAPLATFVLPVIGLFLAPIYPTINSVMLSALPKSEHAGMTGLLVVFSALGGTTGSLVTGQIFTRFDGQTAFYLVIVPMIALLATLAGFRRISIKAAESLPFANRS